MAEQQRPLRIAQVAPLWARVPPVDYGGTELRLSWLADGLVRRGHAVTLFAAGDAITSAQLHAVYPRNLMDAMRAEELDSYAHYANAALAEALRASHSFDIIHCHSEIDHLPFAILSRAPVVYSLRTALSPDDQWLIQRYPEITFVAMSGAQIKELPQTQRARIPVIYNGCDFAAYDLGPAPRSFLVFLGRMGRHKNPLAAIQIAQAVGMPIVLAGQPQDNSEQAYFEREIRPLIDGALVRYIGPVNQAQKRALLREAAALLFPIQWEEPFGNVMIEAMASGTPVLACQRGSVAEVVDAGVTGFYAHSAEELVGLVPQALALDSAAVRAHAEQRFSHERMTDAYLQLYRALLQARSQEGTP